MSATYNWKYKSGSVISINNDLGGGWTVAASADGVRPSNCCYVALFGNDITGNGSRLYPYKTIGKAVTVNTANNNIIVGSGTYREAIDKQISLIGDGDVVLDGTGYPVFSGTGCALKNVTVKNFISISGVGYLLADNCTFMDIGGNGNAGLSDLYLNCTFIRINSTLKIYRALLTAYGNNTYIDCIDVRISNTLGLRYTQWNFIFYRCNIVFVNTSCISNSLFYNCNFRFDSTITTPTVYYPSVPTGYTQINNIADLRALHLSGYPSTTFNFVACVVDDPLFNNYSIDDCTLSFASPAKNLSFLGTFVGSKSIAQSLKIRSVDTDGDFDFSSAVNVTIADDSITLTDPTQDAIIETKVITNAIGRQLKSIPIIGFNADRNGQYIDSIANLDTVTKSAGDVLGIPTSYLVESGSITYNSAIYTAGQRLTTVTGQTTFTTTTGGVLREILEAPQRHTIEMKFSDVQPFTTEAYNHFEPGITPTTNNVGDSRTGAILRGNGDPAYLRGSTVEFPINSKYIKIRFIIRANNLKP